MTATLTAEAAHCPLLRVTSLGQSARGQKKSGWCAWPIRPSPPARHGPYCWSCAASMATSRRPRRPSLHLLRGVAGGRPGAAGGPARRSRFMSSHGQPGRGGRVTRRNAAGADLNRDWGVFSQPETRAVARAVATRAPAGRAGRCTTGTATTYNANCVEVARADAHAAGPGRARLQQDAVGDLARSGYSRHPTAYGADSRPAPGAPLAGPAGAALAAGGDTLRRPA